MSSSEDLDSPATSAVPDLEAGPDEELARQQAEAQRLGMDLNDYLEEKNGWGDCSHLLEASTFPFLRPDAVVLELAVGTGRWSRHLAGQLSAGELHLMDSSPGNVNLLREYFQSAAHVCVHGYEGYTLPGFSDESVDLVCSFDTFLHFQLGQFYAYGKEFYRILRPEGYVILNFLDLDADTGWACLEAHTDEESAPVYTYFTADVVEELFQHVGFEIEKSREYLDNFHFIVLRKPGLS